MFGGTRGKKIISQNIVPMIQGSVATAKAKGITTPDRDGVLLFVGWLQFSILRFLLKSELKESEIMSLLMSAALAVRSHAAGHDLGVRYLEVSRDQVQSAFIESKGTFKWVALYYDKISELVSMNRVDFLAILARETFLISDILRLETINA